ncbi:MAG TPA: molecular chaperone TorD family protein [Streptosporangiaceae bacterium]|nr:molecular chaperone TorD family protein [Streptosporangiaceae bacterium]
MGLGRWKLLRALGAVAADPAAAADLGLPPAGTTGRDEVFTVNCPPYASLYAGDDQGRLAAFWAAAGLDPAAEPDHLAVLLDRYAGLGEAGEDGARRVLFGEFVWPWLPAYLGAVSDLPAGPLTRWAELTLDALRDEREQDRDWGLEPGGSLPWALCDAPPPVGLGGLGELVEGLLTPLRSGMILTRRAVAAGAEQVGAGQRIGNRRRALDAMLAAEPERAARWLAGEADRWARRHASGQLGPSQDETSPDGASRDGSAGSDPVQLWWAERAAGTARLLSGIDALRGAGEARDPGETHGTRGQEGVRGGQETESVSVAD